ncbi:gluconokinase [Aureimonas endophytica]|uniref:Gluconokinase n=1 Tax=Aureimonas endophytica TaxID=2027858 RepID=A0A917E7L7_9HYPH|nr:gluconokinase [Aureimonas endophytica]GGE06915.1 gluconokinase [Aureimonas endophytica]
MAADGARRPMAIVVMGTSGVGKTTAAKGIAAALDWPFAEADEFHPKANIAKMSSGIPLTDEDRWPWLRAIRDWIDARAEEGKDVVVTCSALKRRYRDLLREARADLRFVFLTADPALVAQRIGTRSGHFMPPELLRSQLADLEPLEPGEPGVAVGVDAPPEAVVRRAIEALGLTGKG